MDGHWTLYSFDCVGVIIRCGNGIGDDTKGKEWVVHDDMMIVDRLELVTSYLLKWCKRKSCIVNNIDKYWTQHTSVKIVFWA